VAKRPILQTLNGRWCCFVWDYTSNNYEKLLFESPASIILCVISVVRPLLSVCLDRAIAIPAPRHSASQTGQRMERVSTSREVQFSFSSLQSINFHQLPSTSIRTTRAIPGVYRRQPQVVDQTDQTFSLRRTVWPQKSGALGALGAPGPVGSYDFSTDVLTTCNKYNMLYIIIYIYLYVLVIYPFYVYPVGWFSSI
jgi:hypothetical protein